MSIDIRQKFHLEPNVGLLNDPNGLIQYKGIYYVFFQWNRFEKNLTYKEWGLFTSKNLTILSKNRPPPGQPPPSSPWPQRAPAQSPAPAGQGRAPGWVPAPVSPPELPPEASQAAGTRQ